MSGRGRSRSGVVLLVLAGLLVPVAVLATWTARTVTDTGAFVERVVPAAATPEVHAYLEEQVAGQVRRALVEDRLGPRVGGAIDDLSAPDAVKDLLRDVAAGLPGVVDSTVRGTVQRVLEEPRFRQSFEAAAATAHGELVALLDTGTDAGALVADGDAVGIRVASVGEAVRAELSANGYTFVDRLPRTEVTVPIATVERLESWQRWYTVLEVLGWLGPVLVVLLLLAGAWLRRDLAVAGLWFGVTALVALVVVTVVVRGAMRSAATGLADPLAADAAGAVLAMVTETLTRDATVVGIVLVLLLAASAWSAARSGTAPRPAD